MTDVLLGVLIFVILAVGVMVEKALGRVEELLKALADGQEQQTDTLQSAIESLEDHC